MQYPRLEHTGALGVQSRADLHDPRGRPVLSASLGPLAPNCDVHWHQPHLLQYGASGEEQSELVEHCCPDMVEMVENKRRVGKSIVRVIYHAVITVGEEPEEHESE